MSNIEQEHQGACTPKTSSQTSKQAKRGRPKKKPEYDHEQNINELLEQVVSLFMVPFDDRKERPPDAPNISFVADSMNTSRMRVRKLLITAGYYSTAMSRKVNGLYQSGLTVKEICEETGYGRSAVHSVLPYEKGIYKLADPTLNAEQCQQFQWRKKSVELLAEHMDEEVGDRYLWEAIRAFEDYNFHMENNDRIKYSIDREKICFETVTIRREEISEAFRKARKIQCVEGCVRNAGQLRCRGAEELYSVFLRIGVCNKSGF